MWKIVKLEELFDFQNGRGFKKSEWRESGLPIIRIQNLNNVDAEFNYFDGDYDASIEVNNGDLLFSWSGTVGTSFGAHIWEREKGVLNQHIFKLTKKKDIDTRYAFYCLKNITRLIEQSVVGAVGIRHVTKKNLIAFEIPLPPLAEQQRIVATLDAAFADIDRVVEIENKKGLALDLLERNFLEQVFSTSHPVMKVGDLAEVKSGGTPKSTNASYWNGDIPWYSSGELNNLFTSPSEKFITVDGLNNSNAKLFPKGSLLVGMYDTAAMKMSILQEEATFNQAIVGIPPNQFASAEYLFYALKFLKPTILLERRGVRQQNLSLAKIKEIEVPLPTRDVQNKIVERLRELDRQQSSYHHFSIQKREKCLLLKSSILAQELQPQRSEAA